MKTKEVNPGATETLFGQKTVTKTTKDGKSHEFEFTLSGNGPMPKDKVTTVKVAYDPDETGTKPIPFGTIEYTYDDVGTFEYTITESEVGPGWSTEPTAVTVTVEITDNGDGTLKANIIGGKATITNTYSVKTKEVNPGADETLFGIKDLVVGVPGAPQTFTFTLSGNGPMPESATATLTYAVGETGAKAIPFGTIEYTYDDIGTYEYTITETNPGDGWTVTGNGAKVIVTITDNGDGTLKAEVEGTAKITNTYDPRINFTVVKSWVGDNPAERPEEISVTLFAMMAAGEVEVAPYRYIGLTADDNWTATATDLPVYEVRPDGRMIRIQYYWREDEVPEGYQVWYNDGAEGTVINNYIGTIIIEDLETPLGLGDIYNNVGECFE